jgi:ABC-type transport system involved in cytochrome c biogenesis permease subunit
VRPDTALFIGAAAAYFAAAVFHHAHLFTGSQTTRRLARLTVAAAVILHGLGLLANAAEYHRCPFVNPGQTVSFMAWCVGLMQFAIELRYDWIVVGALSMSIAFLAVVTSHLLPRAGGPADLFLRSHWLSPHVFAVSVGFASFALAFSLAVVYQVENRLLKRKQLRGVFQRLPPLDSISTAAHWLAAAGFSMLTLGLLTGIIGAERNWAAGWVLDPKVLTSFFAWLIYAAYLVMSGLGGWRGRRTTYFLIAGFIAVLIAYFGVNLVAPGRHQF